MLPLRVRLFGIRDILLNKNGFINNISIRTLSVPVEGASDDIPEKPKEKRFNPLDKVTRENGVVIDQIRPTMKQSFNLAAYVNTSETLQKLLKLKVNLASLDRNPNLATYLLKADFKKDIVPYLEYFKELGIKDDELSYVINRNPNLLAVPLKALVKRIDYFKFRNFSKTQITTILLSASDIFSLEIPKIDGRILSLINEYSLRPSEIRHLIVNYPRIVELSTSMVKKCSIMFVDEMGFSQEETKNILLQYPIMWRKYFKFNGHEHYLQLFNYLHNEMKLSHETISETPQIFSTRLPNLSARHQYLERLGRAQYNPKEPLFVPLKAFYLLDVQEFCLKYAKTPSADFYRFMKEL